VKGPEVHPERDHKGKNARRRNLDILRDMKGCRAASAAENQKVTLKEHLQGKMDIQCFLGEEQRGP
jgi:hypothetical protein